MFFPLFLFSLPYDRAWRRARCAKLLLVTAHLRLIWRVVSSNDSFFFSFSPTGLPAPPPPRSGPYVCVVRGKNKNKNYRIFAHTFFRATLLLLFLVSRMPGVPIKIAGVTSTVKIQPSLVGEVGVLIDKEATVAARASVNHEGLNGLVEAKRFKAAAVQRRCPRCVT